ncbi:hypothetical protein A9R05_27745 [Burkholderia sp. KK1]|nr:hypothetical protein A9R05_27745 [Burkholderia sp. KK1]
MFSGLSKLADKSFVLGFFLPALIGTIVTIALIQGLRPYPLLTADWTKQQSIANLTVALLIVWTLSVLLMAGSHWMYRVLEGYSWPLRLQTLKDRQLKRRLWQRERVREAYVALTSASPVVNCDSGNEIEEIERKRLQDICRLQYLGLRRTLLLEYPEQRELVLPTRFGNVLRAFEMYAGNVYGVESIHAWPRLLAVVPKDYQTILADARAPVDFFVSSVFLSVAVGVVALLRATDALVAGHSLLALILYSSIGLAAFVVGRLSYLAAVSSAIAWGEVVKSAFDLYLPALAKALGYDLPNSSDDRRRFWETLATQFQFQEAMRPEDWPERATENDPSGVTEPRNLEKRVEEVEDDDKGTSEFGDPEGKSRP